MREELRAALVAALGHSTLAWAVAVCPPTGLSWHSAAGGGRHRAVARQFLSGVAAPGADLKSVAIAGKKVRGASRTGGQSVALLSALSQRLGVVLQQTAIETSEQTEFEDLLAELVLTGCVITTDALQTTAANAAQVLAQGGDYLFVVKDNQPTLRAEIELVFQTTTLADTIEEVVRPTSTAHALRNAIYRPHP